MNILGKRYIFFGISLLIILVGIGIIVFRGIPLSIDFTGGSLLEVQFEGRSPETTEIYTVYDEAGIEDVQVQTSDTGSYIIRSQFLENDDRDAVIAALSDTIGEVIVVRFDSVGPSIGEQVTSRGALAVAVSSLLVVLFIAWSFRGVTHAFRYGICAILAMIHDVGIIFSATAIGSILWGWEVDSLFLTALLTVIGFSMQDTIVVFDRIRENSSIYRRLDFETLVNHSIVQTLQRSINTQLMTVEFLLLALAMFGGVTLREFAGILLIGLLSGTYSSIFIAAPILVLWENREWKTWFRKPAAA
jgi:preprotein translocase subunit SecF